MPGPAGNGPTSGLVGLSNEANTFTSPQGESGHPKTPGAPALAHSRDCLEGAAALKQTL